MTAVPIAMAATPRPLTVAWRLNAAARDIAYLIEQDNPDTFPWMLDTVVVDDAGVRQS